MHVYSKTCSLYYRKEWDFGNVKSNLTTNIDINIKIANMKIMHADLSREVYCHNIIIWLVVGHIKIEPSDQNYI